MGRREKRLASLAFALCLAATGVSAQEAVSFASLDGQTTLTSYLTRPSGDQPRPAVVLLHGCSGLTDAKSKLFPSYHAWHRTLTSAGFVTLSVDSARSRGFRATCNPGPERRTMLRDRPKDAYGALQFLQRQPFVDPARIAVMGYSQGGGIVLLTINDKSIGRPKELAHDFRAAIAFYPGSCNDAYQSKPYTQVEPQSWKTTIPLLVLVGEADNWTLYPPCESFISAAKARGNPVEIKSYPDAGHGFDAPNNDRRELEAYRLPNGAVPVVGTHDEARADAVLRTLAFLRKAFSP